MLDTNVARAISTTLVPAGLYVKSLEVCIARTQDQEPTPRTVEVLGITPTRNQMEMTATVMQWIIRTRDQGEQARVRPTTTQARIQEEKEAEPPTQALVRPTTRARVQKEATTRALVHQAKEAEL